MKSPWTRRARRGTCPQDDHAGFDPIALTLAIWLGLVACVVGVARLSEAAASQAALAQSAAQSDVQAGPGTAPMSGRMMAFGG